MLCSSMEPPLTLVFYLPLSHLSSMSIGKVLLQMLRLLHFKMQKK
jgi:hypothetical protein